MTDIFLRIVELSRQAGVLALAVMLARLALRRAPKWAVCLLWALVAVRLVLPFSLQSPVSLQAAQRESPRESFIFISVSRWWIGRQKRRMRRSWHRRCARILR